MELHPVTAVEWEESEGGVTVHVPRRFPLNYVARVVRKVPHVRLNLDRFGSFVWRRCDGNNSAFEIARALEQEFGVEAVNAVPRISLFLKRLVKERLITYQELP